MDLKEFKATARRLLDQLADRLPPDRLAQYRTFADVGEWVELVDALAASLVKRKTPLTPAERDDVAALLNYFDLPRDGYRFINGRDEVFASLNVVPTS
jgi:hypothetical protein